MRCGKQTGVGGDTAHCGGVLIVDFPAYEMFAQIGAIFRGRNAVFEMGRWTIASVGHVERFKYVLFDEAIQTMVANGFEDFAQDEKTHVAVRGICTGFISKGKPAGCVEHRITAAHGLPFICVHLRPSADVFVQMNMRGQAAAMGEQMPNCDAVLVFASERGHIILHGCVEVETPFIGK